MSAEVFADDAALDDQGHIRALLEACGLPTMDLATSQPQFIVSCEEGRIIATGALQRCAGCSALLRSVAVAADARGRGLGQSIVRELERIALSEGIEWLTLLTQGAHAFFESLGYRVKRAVLGKPLCECLSDAVRPTRNNRNLVVMGFGHAALSGS